MTMKPVDVPSDPADYISGPRGNQTSRGNGGTNRSGGVSIVEVNDGTAAEPAAEGIAQGEPAPPAAPAQ